MRREVVLVVHVDDMCLMGTRSGVDRLKQALGETFMIKWMGEIGKSLFLELALKRDRERRQILVSQRHYALQILQRFGMTEANACTTPINTKEDCTLKPEDIPLNPQMKKTH